MRNLKLDKKIFNLFLCFFVERVVALECSASSRSQTSFFLVFGEAREKIKESLRYQRSGTTFVV